MKQPSEILHVLKAECRECEAWPVCDDCLTYTTAQMLVGIKRRRKRATPTQDTENNPEPPSAQREGPVSQGEKPKRKRRTKAEMEAAREEGKQEDTGGPFLPHQSFLNYCKVEYNLDPDEVAQILGVPKVDETVINGASGVDLCIKKVDKAMEGR